MPDEYWRLEHDGSLRNNGAEYVLRRPLRGVALIHALEALNQVFVKYRVVPVESHRTSVHIHIDCTDMTPRQVGKYMLGLVMFEQVLMGWVSPTRENNPYCVPIGGDEAYTQAIGRLLNYEGKELEGRYGHVKTHLKTCISGVESFDGRYSSINVCSLPKYGTIEVRMLEGTHEIAKVRDWINILLGIKLWSKRMEEEDVQLLFEGFSAVDTHVWMQGNLGPKVTSLLSRVSEKEARLLDGLRNAQDILHADAVIPDNGKVDVPFVKRIGLKVREDLGARVKMRGAEKYRGIMPELEIGIIDDDEAIPQPHWGVDPAVINYIIG